jgi:cytidylate kinase
MSQPSPKPKTQKHNSKTTSSPKIVIAIDGPAGCGKSTIAQRLAEKLGFEYLDTGAMYRALTWKALEKRIDPLDEETLTVLARESRLVFKTGRPRRSLAGGFRIFIDELDVTRAIRTFKVTDNVSAVSSLPGVRRVMVEKQRTLVEKEKNGVVVEGRDIGTVVFPQANLKIYLTATPHERAVRRQKDFLKMGRKISVAALEREIIRRDRIDSTRRDSPLTKAPGAHSIDTTNKSINQVVQEILGIGASLFATLSLRGRRSRPWQSHRNP